MKNLIEKILKRVIEKQIFYKEFESNTKFGVKVKAYIKVERSFNIDSGVWYNTSTNNISCGRKKLLDSVFRILEHECIGMAKYNICKELLKEKNIKDFHY